MIKVAYIVFLLSFSVWLAVIGITLFPAVTTTDQIQFPNPTLQTLFVGSAVTSAMACMIIGVDYLGLRVKPRNRTGTSEKLKPIHANLQTKQASTISSRIERKSAAS